LSAIEETGLRSFLTRRVVERFEALGLALFAENLLTAFVEGYRHQRILGEILTGLNQLLGSEQTLDAVRGAIRRELSSLFGLFRADAYLVRKFVILILSFIEESRNDPGRALRREFDQFEKGLIEKLKSSPEYAGKAETLKRDLLARPEISNLADELWQSVRRFLERDVQSGNSVLEIRLGGFLADIRRQLASEVQDINAMVLQTFVQAQKREIA
jgi:uncharacterized membrane-anchored protein YjiN (DUF445 family)